MQNTTTDTTLAVSLKAKQLPAFQQFYTQYAPALYGDVCRRLHLQKAADETFTSAFVKIWDSIDQYDPSKERLFTWSLKLAREEACQAKVKLALEALFACRRPVAARSK